MTTSCDNLTFRPARPEDADAVSDIYAQAFPHLFRFAFGLGREETAFLLGDLYRHGLMSYENIHVAESAQRVVGFALLHTTPRRDGMRLRAYWRVLRRNLGLMRGLRALGGSVPVFTFLDFRASKNDMAYLDILAVHEAERGRGIGRRLLDYCFALAREAGCAEIGLHVLDTNTNARRLYARVGFVVRKEERFLPRLTYRFAGFHSAFLMVKTLG